jgi:hypothetical protein
LSPRFILNRKEERKEGRKKGGREGKDRPVDTAFLNAT